MGDTSEALALKKLPPTHILPGLRVTSLSTTGWGFPRKLINGQACMHTMGAESYGTIEHYPAVSS